MGGDSVHIVEKVVFVYLNLADYHLINKLGCNRLPGSRGALHRPRDIKLANELMRLVTAWIKKFDGVYWEKKFSSV